MTDHFRGKYEAELKFRISDPEPVQARLEALQAQPYLLDNHEVDHYFESPSATLGPQRISMCLREMQPSGIRLWIVKGPGESQCEAVNISDCAKAAVMLETLGFHPYFRMEKERSIYFCRQFHITLDHLPGLGHFTEVAIMTDDAGQLPELYQQLTLFARELGLRDQSLEKRSYRRLLGY